MLGTPSTNSDCAILGSSEAIRGPTFGCNSQTQLDVRERVYSCRLKEIGRGCWTGAENDVRNRWSDETRWSVGGLKRITTGSKETNTRKNVATHNVGLNNGRSKVGFRDCSWYEGTTVCRPWDAAVWLQEERSWGKSSIAAGGSLTGGGRGTDLEISDVTRPKGLELGREVAFSTGSRVGATVNQGRKRGQDTGRTLGPHGEKLTGLTGHCLGPTST